MRERKEHLDTLAVTLLLACPSLMVIVIVAVQEGKRQKQARGTKRFGAIQFHRVFSLSCKCARLGWSGRVYRRWYRRPVLLWNDHLS